MSRPVIFWFDFISPYSYLALTQAERFARDPQLVEAYRHRFAHHGFHPFTVWYWATYPLRYLSRVILVGPPNDRAAKRLGVSWAASLGHALGWAREITGGDDVVALTIPPFMYLSVNGRGPHGHAH